MSFLRRDARDRGATVRATALVVEAEGPVKGAPRWGNVGRRTVRVLVDAGAGFMVMERELHLAADQWLVTGMQIPVLIEAARPDRFEVDWQGVPSIEERVAANDPTLADPRAAHQRVTEALQAAGVAPGPAWATAQQAAAPDHFAEAMQRAAGAQAPAGKVRAVVLIPQIRRKWDDDTDSTYLRGRTQAVLSVYIPGGTPYAVFDTRFKSERGHVIQSAPLPALVSTSDRNDVEILWDETPTVGDAIGEKIGATMQTVQAQMAQVAEFQRQMMERAQQPLRQPAAPQTAPPMPASAPRGTPPPSGPPAVAAGAVQLPAGMREMMLQNAKMALQYVQDPAQRQLLIQQYRLAGIEIDDQGNVTG